MNRNQRRSPKTSPASALNTPIWQVTDDETRKIVTTSAYGTLSSVGLPCGQSPGCAARTVKYIANRPAKNISSLDSQMIVPTLTMLGRVSECALPPSYVAVVTAASFHGSRRAHLAGLGACSRRSRGTLRALPPGPRKASAGSPEAARQPVRGALSGQHGE